MTVNLDEIRSSLRERYDEFERCCDQRDADRLVREFYTPDALMGGTGLPLTHGREAIREIVSGLVNAVTNVRVEVLEVRAGPDANTAYDITNVHAELPDGTRGTDRACCVWRRISDGWRVDVDWVIRG